MPRPRSPQFRLRLQGDDGYAYWDSESVAVHVWHFQCHCPVVVSSMTIILCGSTGTRLVHRLAHQSSCTHQLHRRRFATRNDLRSDGQGVGGSSSSVRKRKRVRWSSWYAGCAFCGVVGPLPFCNGVSPRGTARSATDFSTKSSSLATVRMSMSSPRMSKCKRSTQCSSP